MLPRLFFEHFTGTSFAIERDGQMTGFLIGSLSQSRPGGSPGTAAASEPRQRALRPAEGW